ncbi:MAG: ABC-F family ATP-binding cassette domain-containing protein, partial [Actinomycetota bacterium]|nr:ABC-F family ATP-binding cassette domain-containing protein [Actinomycetota bacterium]
MGHLLGANNLRVEYPTRVVLDGITIGINDGGRIGVVGRNGEGKSTLIRALAGRLTPDSGDVISRNGLMVGMLDQSDQIPDDVTVEHAVVGDRVEHEWAGDARVRDVITGLLSDVPWGARIGDLSGGQSRRVSLAALMVHDWDVLFLDEPTNHLDVMGVAWLSRHLATRWPTGTGALVVVTHDRWFLDASTQETWEVHDGIVDAYEGGYAAYILQRVERERSSAVTEAKRQNLLKKELAWLRRGAPARTAKPKFRIEAANALINDVPEIRDPVSLAKVATTRLGKKVIELEDVSVSYGDTTILKPLTWRLAPGERTGILGANGAGKSTLLGLISGTLQPSSGTTSRGSTVKLSILDQRLATLSDVLQDRVSEVIARKKTSYKADGVEMTPGQLLERLGFSSAHLSARVFELSGGQRRRLQFLLELLEEPNVLLLDEPTNDLDTDMLRAMEDLLDTWPGTLIVVSHDRYLLERVTDQQFAILDGEFRHLPGGIDEYLRLENAQEDKALREVTHAAAPSAVAPENSSPGLRPGSKEHREAEKEHRSLEKKIQAGTNQLQKIDADLADADQGDFKRLTELGHIRQEL